MMTDSSTRNSDESVGARLSRDDENAWMIVCETVGPKVTEILHRKYGPDKQMFSADDAFATALRTFYRNLKEGRWRDKLDNWDDLRRLLVTVASNKIIDGHRKAKLEANLVAKNVTDAKLADSNSAKNSAVLNEIFAGEYDQAIEETMAKLQDALRDDIERLVFRGKLDELRHKEIAERIARSGEQMTEGRVKEVWRMIRTRLKDRFPELPDALFED